LQKRDPDRRVLRANSNFQGEGIVEAALASLPAAAAAHRDDFLAFIAGTIPLVLSHAPAPRCARDRRHVSPA